MGNYTWAPSIGIRVHIPAEPPIQLSVAGVSKQKGSTAELRGKTIATHTLYIYMLFPNCLQTQLIDSD